MTRCRLCNKETNLLKKSHIIPDFFYRESRLYNKNHQLNLLITDNKSKKISRYISQNSGIYEKSILCSSCDNKILGNLESYLKPLFFGGTIGSAYNPEFKTYNNGNGRVFTRCTNISYDKTKLALLSILWRASISRNPFFKDIQLNLEIEEELRIMLIANDPKEINKFPIVCLSAIGPNESLMEVIAQPQSFNHHRGSGYVFLISGMFIHYYLSHSFNDTELNNYSISPNNCMTIIQIKNGEEFDWIMTFLGFIS